MIGIAYYLLHKFLLNLIRLTLSGQQGEFVYRTAIWLCDRYPKNSFVIRDVHVLRVFLGSDKNFLSLKLNFRTF